MADLKAEGLSMAEIEAELRCDESTVSRTLKKAKRNGDAADAADRIRSFLRCTR